MLDKVVRQLVDIYIEPTDIDFELERTEAKFHWLQVNPAGKGDKLYRHRPEVMTKEIHPILGCMLYRRKVYDSVYFDRPSEELAKAYELKKKTFMDNYYRNAAAGIEKRALPKGNKRESVFKQAYDLVKADLNDYRKDELDFMVVDFQKVLARHPELSRNNVYDVVRAINSELGVVARGCKWIKVR